MAIPFYSGYNIIDWYIYDRLRNLWKNESERWSQGERRDFVEWVPKARITERENTIANHNLAVYMRQNRPNWGHFVILRAMFGASQCARQSWWTSFKLKYDRATENAPPGVVLRDVGEVLRTNRMKPPPITNIPTMEVKDSHVEKDCQCPWCLKNSDKASRKKGPASQDSRAVEIETQQEYFRGQSIYTGEGETREDRARRFQREEGVEPEATQDEDKIGEEWSEFTARASSLRERLTLVPTDASNRSLMEVVIEQGGMIESLARLLEKQHKRIQRLVAKVDKGQKKTDGYYRDINRRMKNGQRVAE
ncbi:hypothetical protein ACHAQJ_003349 [Trichoderma viride]